MICFIAKGYGIPLGPFCVMSHKAGGVWYRVQHASLSSAKALTTQA